MTKALHPPSSPPCESFKARDSKELNTMKSSKMHFVPRTMAISKLVMAFLAFFTFCCSSFAYDLYVNASADTTGADGSSVHPYVKIQDAIDHAFNDSLAVNQTNPPPQVVIKVADSASGYSENLTVYFRGDNYYCHLVSDITIQSRSNNPDNCAIIAMDSSLPVITVKGTENSVLTLKGLGIKHSVSGAVNYGIYLNPDNSGVGRLDTFTVDNCVFDYNNFSIRVGNHMNQIKLLNSKIIRRSLGGFDIYSNIPDLNMIDSLYVKGCEFLNTVQNKITSSVSISARSFEIYDNHFENVTVGLSGISYPIGITVKNNTFQGSKIVINSKPGNWLIEGNQFTCLSPYYGSDHSIVLQGGARYIPDICLIKGNTFYGCNRAISVQLTHFVNSFTDSYWGRHNVAVSNNSFINCGEILQLCRLANMQEISNKISLYRDNLYYGTSSTPFTVVDHNDNPIVLTGDNRIPITYSHFSTPLTNTSSLVIDPLTVSYGDPHIELDDDNYTYSLLWDDTVRSPCINTGCPEINGVPQTDPDGTPPDIGSVYYPHHHWDYEFNSLQFGSTPPAHRIFWRSFPVLDDRTCTDNMWHNELGYLFNNYMYPPNVQIETVSWSYDGDADDMILLTGGWQNSDYQATQPKGFKTSFIGGTDPISPIVVDGFKANPATTPVKLYGGPNHDFENWIGYFVPYTQGAGDAFSRPLPGNPRETYIDYIFSIGTQHWSTSRRERRYGSPWIVDPNRYTVSEGDMLSITLLPDAPEEMYWACLGTATPRVREMPEQFSYVEKLDYIPIFIQFDPDNLPDEVGLIAAGECKGAAVVDSSLIEVNFYPSDSAKGDDEIEILFYYGSKGTKKAPTQMVYNPETLLFEAGSLKASQIGDYGYISFYHEAGSSLVPLATELKQNYPNPFKGSTTISWVMAKDEPVKIEIYNLRGQKVTTLYDGWGKKGRQAVSWDAKDAKGQSVASGVYFYRLSTPKESKVQKMMVIKN